MNSKLKKIIKTEKLRGGYMLDCYNQLVIKNNISPTITTRVSASNEIFVVVEVGKNEK